MPNNNATTTQQQPQQPQQQPAVYIMVQQPQPSLARGQKSLDQEHFAKTFPPRLVRALSAAQIFIFVVCIITAIMGIIFEKYGPSDGAAGIWCGLFFGISGALGMLAAWKATSCSIISCMVLNIIGACFTVPVLVFSGISLGTSSYRYRPYGSNSNDNDSFNRAAIVVTAAAIQFCCALFQAVIALTVSVLACRATCCRTTRGEVYDHNAATVVYQNPDAANLAGNAATAAVPITAIPLMPHAGAAGSTNQDNPPKYEEAAVENKKNQGESENDGRYQRFD